MLTGRDCGAHVLNAVSQGEGDLLHGRGSRLRHVIAGDGDCVPAWQLLAAVGEDVGGEAQGFRRWIDIGTPGDVLLEQIVLDRPVKGRPGDPLLLRDQLVEQEQDRGG